jgi:hypothetical protein
MSRQTILLLIIALILGVCTLAAAHIIATYMPWNDTVARHIGCQAFLQRESPYTPEVNAAIAIYNTDPTLEQRFSYPAHFCLMTLPLWILPYEITLRLWIALNLAGFIVLPIVFFRLFKVRLTPLQMLGLVVMTLFGFRYSMMTVVLAQYVGLVMVCFWGAVWFLIQKRDLLAAVCLMLVTFRPEAAIMATALAVLVLPRRPKVLLYYGAGLAVLVGISHLFIGTWEFNFLNDMRAYSGYNTNFVWLPLLLSTIGAVILCGLLLIWIAWGLVTVWRTSLDEVRYILLAGILIIAGLVLIPQTNPYTLIFLLPLVYWLMLQFQQQPLLLWGIPLFTGSFTWILFAVGRSAANIDQLLFPVVIAVLLFFAIRQKNNQDAVLAS